MARRIRNIAKLNSRSHSDAQLGISVHFILKYASKTKFNAENDGADRFLKNGAQNSIMAAWKFNMAAIPGFHKTHLARKKKWGLG